MVLIILEKTPVGLRGELTRWLIQPKAGVFVGRISALVREKLWDRILKLKRTGGVIMIYSSNTEQGFAIRTYGPTSRRIEDFGGISLAKTPLSE